MKLINSRGRVLLEVTSATASDEYGIIYRYKGDNCGGYTTEYELMKTIKCIQSDAPSARLVGVLPTVQP